MLTNQILQILFFSFIPIGIVLLIIGIQKIITSVSKPPLLNLVYSDKTATFILPKSGQYDIWHKGKLFNKTMIRQFKPKITSLVDGKDIKLKPTIFRTQVNGFDYGRTKLYYFNAKKGEYKIDLLESSNPNKFKEILNEFIPIKEVDKEDYFIQVRYNYSVYKLFLLVAFILLSFFLTVGGLILGLNI